MQALDIHGARSRNRTGTPLRAGDFKSRARIKRAAAWMRFLDRNSIRKTAIRPNVFAYRRMIAARKRP